MARPLSGVERRFLLTACALVALSVLVGAVVAALGLGGADAELALRDLGSTVVYVLVAGIVALRAVRVERARRAWSLLAVGLGLYGLGGVLWTTWVEHLPHPPIPSVCDALWLSLYPISYIGLLALARRDDGARLPAVAWLDGIIAGCGAASLGAALVFRPVLASLRGDVLAAATELAYPVGDVLLVVLVIAVLAVRGWRMGRMWWMLVVGFIVLAAADSSYAVQVAHGVAIPSALMSLGYVTGPALLGLAAWQPDGEPHRRRMSPRRLLAIPAACGALVVGLLQLDHLRRLDPISFALVDLTLLAALVRGMLAVHAIRELAEIREAADTDDLTALPNRRALRRLFREAIERARRDGSGLAMLMIDLDNFKEINDTLGHDAGDELLQRIGPRLRRCLGGSDLVARLGGDEFAVVLVDCSAQAAANAAAEAILEELRTPFVIGDLRLRVTASVGIAQFPEHGTDARALFARSDMAMYEAKRARRGIGFYEARRDTHSTERLSLASRLALAIDRDELEVHFQPKAHRDSRRIVGVEALVRWRREDGSLIAPCEFLDVAERTGLSRALTTSVLGTTLRQLAAWRAQGIDIHAAVNTTVSDLHDLGFPTRVRDMLGAAGIDPGDLVLEVTESSILTDPERITQVLQSLRELGVGISLDDFGTGYSSLSHLVNLPVGELKIDRSFVGASAHGEAGMAVVQAMVGLGHELGLRVVAEGVEDEVTWARLVAMGCDLVQGYGLCRPLPAGELTPRLLADSAARAAVTLRP